MDLIILFPGLGSQYVGMGKDLYENFTQARALYHTASEIIGLDIARISFYGPTEELNKLINTEVAIVLHSLATFELLKKQGVVPKAMAGHSLGEYTALAAAQVISFKDVIRLVYKRARLIEELVNDVKGTMLVVIGINAKSVRQICLQCQDVGLIEIVNYNSPLQFVVSGKIEAITKFKQLAAVIKGCFTVDLPINYPLHSSFMAPVKDALLIELDQISFTDAHIPVVTNCNGRFERNANALRQSLIKQVSGTVLWEKVVRNILARGKDTIFIEVGPGKVLHGLVKKIYNQATVLNAYDSQSLKKTVKELAGIGFCTGDSNVGSNVTPKHINHLQAESI